MTRTHAIMSSALLAWSCAADQRGEPGSTPPLGDGASIEAGAQDDAGTSAVDVEARGDPLVPSFDASVDASRDVGSIADVSGSDARADAVWSDATTLPGCNAATAHARADAALDRMIAGFWNDSSRYFDAAEPTNGKLTGYWTFAQAFDAVLDGVERTMGRKYFADVAMLYAAQNARGWSSSFYDDENWMVLALMRAFDLTGERAYLDRAVALYLDITAAWDSTSAAPGGIWWDRSHTQKATASNAGPVIAGARLAARTGDAAHLAFARKAYEFWSMKMVDPVTYRLADHMLPDGTIVRGLLTYNEGLMSGAAYALYLATGEARFLTDAHGIAQALIKNETKPTTVGPVLTDGTNTGCVGDCPQWKGIAYRYLATLFRQDLQRTDYRTVLEASVEAAWTLARDPTTGFFANDWRGPPTTSASIEAQSSSAMALSLFASLCGPYQAD
jgi:predicted alpha-1,6-mannanase (GH76 family)